MEIFDTIVSIASGLAILGGFLVAVCKPLRNWFKNRFVTPDQRQDDRIAAMEAELRACGGVLESEGGTITVQGCADRLHAPAGVLHGHNDHRVVMSLAVLALSTGIPLTVDDAEAITKSWPNFFEAIKPLGAEVEYA